MPTTDSCSRPPDVGPLDRQLDLLIARRDTHLVRQALDGLDRDAGDAGRPLRGVLGDPLLEHLERGFYRPAVDFVAAQQVGVTALAPHVDRAVCLTIPPKLVLGVEASLFDRLVGADEHAEIVRRRVEVHQFGRVGVIDQEVAVVKPLIDDLVGNRQQQRAVGARLDRHPFIGDRRVAGTHRVDRDESPAASLELGDRHLERVRVMILGGTDHHEQLGAVEVGSAELPERSADRVDQAGRHVDRTEAAVRRIVGRAELARKHAGQGLHLVTPGEQRELFRVLGTQLCQTFVHDLERLVPGDLFEVGLAACTTGTPQQRSGQARRRILLHDPGGALGTDHPFVQRVVRVALDVAHLAVAQRHADAAATGTHIAGRVLDLFPAGFGVDVHNGIQHAQTFA